MGSITKSNKLSKNVLDAYDFIEILESFPFNEYHFNGYSLSAEDQKITDGLSAFFSRKLSLEKLRSILTFSKKEEFLQEFSVIVQSVEADQLLDLLPLPEKVAALEKSLQEIFSKYFAQKSNALVLAQMVVDNSVGFGELAPLLRDEHLEEVMVNSAQKPVFVFHKKFGMCKTNIVATHEQNLRSLIIRIAKHSGKAFDEINPLLDARLPDGSRVNATLSTITPSGTSLTVRKFTKIPLSIVDFLEKKTISYDLASFLWLMVEGMTIEPMNIIVTGGTGSGKTTLLNVLSTFIRHSDRIVSIEDTLELDLGTRENWIQMEAKPSIHGSVPVTMDDLLKNSLRMRPDRLVVGEVRGEEAQTMFAAMDTGHKGILGTLHSNSAREMLVRLKSKPMSVPNSMLPLLDLTVVMFKMYDREIGVLRRIKEVSEVSRMEDKVLLSTVFEWDKGKDDTGKTDVPSHLFDYLAEKSNMTKTQLRAEQLVRQRILQWLVENKIKDSRQVEEVIQEYYIHPTNILEKISKDL
ncbi:MAG: ATPase, T2SS/T4P/T4SS family [Candidatus Diapherotrites archaeon]|nr:ATPase, T2SS/T4P/T4SS family [Candidatus Diapherotrites archaeon]